MNLPCTKHTLLTHSTMQITSIKKRKKANGICIISSLRGIITTALLRGAPRFALKPSLLTPCGKGVTRRSNGEMTVLHQLKILPGQSKEWMRMCQRWGGRQACNVYKQMPQRQLECIQSHCQRFPTPSGAHSSAEMHKHRCFSDRVSQRV